MKLILMYGQNQKFANKTSVPKKSMSNEILLTLNLLINSRILDTEIGE